MPKENGLYVFFDGAGEFFRNKIRENIKGRHNFGAVYCIGLLSTEGRYAYSVTEFKKNLAVINQKPLRLR